MDNFPTYTGCGFTGCVTSESGNMCDGDNCSSDDDCISKCCESQFNKCTHDYNKCPVKNDDQCNLTPPDPSPSGDNEGSSLTWLWIVISSLIVLAIMLVLCLVKRKRKKKLEAHLQKEDDNLQKLRDDDFGETDERFNSKETKSDMKESIKGLGNSEALSQSTK